MAEPVLNRSKIRKPVIETAQVNHLPIVAHFARKMGLVEIINRLVPVDMDVEPGVIVLGLILDTLSGRSPLYHLESSFAELDCMLLFGKEIPPGYFSDDNVGRVLDRIFEVGTQKIFSDLSVNAVLRFSIPTNHIHFDTTSVNVYGDYECSTKESSPFNITHGYSKDKRPDLKQFILSLLCADGGIPIVGKIEDGNSSDKTINNYVLSEVSQHMSKFGVADDAFIYIADSAMVTKENLEIASLFITRLPATYNECDRAILSAVDSDQWVDVGCIAKTPDSKKRPNAIYRVKEEQVILYDKQYRAIVVHSSAHDKRREKKLERELSASSNKIKKTIKKIEGEIYFCRADAESAAAKWTKEESKYHQLEVEIVEKPRYKKGRPKKGQARQVESMEYKLSAIIREKDKEVTRYRQLCGCFVLLTDVAEDWDDGYSAERILRTYKEQFAIEKNFGFLKDDQIVNAIFLKKTERIESLGLILLISLLVWRLMEHTMRTELAEKDDTIDGWDNKPTKRPTSYMLTWKFKGIMVISVDGQRQLARPLTPNQTEFLSILKVPLSCFLE